MKTVITTAIISMSLVLPAYAGGQSTALSVDAGNRQDNETRQDNRSSINQTAVYSVGQASTYRIDSVVCPSPALIVSGNVSGNSGVSDSYGASVAMVFPLGGRNTTNCNDALEARSVHYQVQNEVAISKECSGILSAGVNLNEEQFPILSQYCKGVSYDN